MSNVLDQRVLLLVGKLTIENSELRIALAESREQIEQLEAELVRVTQELQALKTPSSPPAGNAREVVDGEAVRE